MIDRIVNEYYICYFDILGYKEMLSKYGENNFLQYMIVAINTVTDIANFEDINYRIFSDNVVLFIPVPPKNSNYYQYNYFFNFITLISNLQRNLMGQYGVFIRGCIIKGNLYFDEQFIYGSGLIEAYQVEDTVAKYPRIIIDNELIKTFYEYDKGIVELFCPLYNEYILKDTDNLYFVNYLTVLTKNTFIEEGAIKQITNDKLSFECLEAIDTSAYNDDILNPYQNFDFYDNIGIQKLICKYKNKFDTNLIGLEYLLIHKILIENRVKKYSNEKILNKYFWCKNYHNNICFFYNIPELKL